MEPLFSDGSLADFLIERWQFFIADLDETEHRFAGAALRGRAEEAKAVHTLVVPVLSPEMRVVEHGPVVDDVGSEPGLAEPMCLGDFADAGDLVRARLRQLEAEIRRLETTRTTIAVPFTGSAPLFRFRPSGCAIPAPLGKVEDQAILMWFERYGKKDQAWKSVLQADLDSIDLILEAAGSEVAAFNTAVARRVLMFLASSGMAPKSE